jgi:hypothetical protein
MLLWIFCGKFLTKEIPSEDNEEAELAQMVTCQKLHFSKNVLSLYIF